RRQRAFHAGAPDRDPLDDGGPEDRDRSVERREHHPARMASRDPATGLAGLAYLIERSLRAPHSIDEGQTELAVGDVGQLDLRWAVEPELASVLDQTRLHRIVAVDEIRRSVRRLPVFHVNARLGAKRHDLMLYAASRGVCGKVIDEIACTRRDSPAEGPVSYARGRRNPRRTSDGSTRAAFR